MEESVTRAKGNEGQGGLGVVAVGLERFNQVCVLSIP